MRSRVLASYFRTLLSVSRLQFKNCSTEAERAVVQREIDRFRDSLKAASGPSEKTSRPRS